MKRVRATVLSLVGSLAVAAVAASLWTGSEFTVCYGVFKSSGAADRAARSAEEAGLEATVDRRRDPAVGRYWAVDFYTGETGNDARGARSAFRGVVERERGEFGHPGGCLERGPID